MQRRSHDFNPVLLAELKKATVDAGLARGEKVTIPDLLHEILCRELKRPDQLPFSPSKLARATA